MKNTDKITLTVGQLKKLVKESKQINENSELDDKETDLYNCIYDLIDEYIIENFSDKYDRLERLSKIEKNRIFKYIKDTINNTLDKVIFDNFNY